MKLLIKYTVLFQKQGIKLRVCLSVFIGSVVETIIATNRYIPKIAKWIGEIDVACSFAKVSKTNGYFRPILKTREDTSEASSVIINDLRHPIVEKLVKHSKYITNDIDFEQTKGMLLYGVNTTGKTTLLKSVALAIVMAQAGCFVAGKMSFTPYHSIFSRLTGNDDILSGKSSFMVEMLELDVIERQADSHSLVVCDELCRGTEDSIWYRIDIGLYPIIIPT